MGISVTEMQQVHADQDLRLGYIYGPGTVPEVTQDKK